MTQVFTTGSGQSIVTGAELGRGGEGTILEVQGDPSRCIKLYTGQIPEPTPGKLTVMVAHPPRDPTLGNKSHHSIAWPEQILYKAPGRAFAGFLMTRVDGKVFRTALSYLTPDARMKDYGGAFNWKYLYTAATNVASSVGALHEKGYCIGDLNESNLLIAPSALITIIDCDSFQVPDPATGKVYRCLVGKPEYTAPELQGHYGEIDRTLASDRFALGVLLFQLLMEGTHPYQARGEAVMDLPSSQQKILKGLFPYARGVRGVSPPAFAPPFELLDLEIRKLFLRCFETGHDDPAARPSAQEWYDTLRARESLLRTCPQNDNHVYFSHLKPCPWCERAQTLRRDSFPKSLGGQIALSDPRAPLATVEARLSHLRNLAALALADGVVTSQERDYLIDRGLELQLTKKQIETLIEGEIRKTGAKQSKAGAPRLVLSTAQLDLKEVQAETRVTATVTLSNQGSGVLTGSLHSNRNWLSCPAAIDPNRHVQKIPIVVDTKGLPPGFTGTGQITIHSNGGDITLTVNLAVELQQSGLQRFRQVAALFGVTLGLIFGTPLAFLGEAKNLTQTGAVLAIPCAVAACLPQSRKAGLAGALWSLLLLLGVHYDVFGLPVGSALTWAALFGSAAWMTGLTAYKLKARGTSFNYPALGVCALQAAIVFGFTYYSAIETRLTDLPKQPVAQNGPAVAEEFRVEVTGAGVNLRSLPSEESTVLATVPRGAVLDVEYSFASWLRVKRPDNPAGSAWIRQDFTRRLGAAAQRPGSAP